MGETGESQVQAQTGQFSKTFFQNKNYKKGLRIKLKMKAACLFLSHTHTQNADDFHVIPRLTESQPAFYQDIHWP